MPWICPNQVGIFFQPLCVLKKGRNREIQPISLQHQEVNELVNGSSLFATRDQEKGDIKGDE